MKQEHKWEWTDPELQQWCITERICKLNHLTKEIWNRKSCTIIPKFQPIKIVVKCVLNIPHKSLYRV